MGKHLDALKDRVEGAARGGKQWTPEEDNVLRVAYYKSHTQGKDRQIHNWAKEVSKFLKRSNSGCITRMSSLLAAERREKAVKAKEVVRAPVLRQQDLLPGVVDDSPAAIMRAEIREQLKFLTDCTLALMNAWGVEAPKGGPRG